MDVNIQENEAASLHAYCHALKVALVKGVGSRARGEGPTYFFQGKKYDCF